MCFFSLFFKEPLYGMQLCNGAAEVNKVLLIQEKAFKLIKLIAGTDYLQHCKLLFIRQSIFTFFSFWFQLRKNFVRIQSHVERMFMVMTQETKIHLRYLM